MALVDEFWCYPMTSRDEARTAITEALIAVPLGIRSPVSDMVDAVWPVVDELIADREVLNEQVKIRNAELTAAQAALEALQTDVRKLADEWETAFLGRGAPSVDLIVQELRRALLGSPKEDK